MSFDGLTVREGRIMFGLLTSRKCRVMFGTVTARPGKILEAFNGLTVRRSSVKDAWWTGITVRKSNILSQVEIDGATLRRCRVGFSPPADIKSYDAQSIDTVPGTFNGYQFFSGDDDITGQIGNGLSISFAGDRVHNEVSFSSISPDLRASLVKGSLFEVRISGDFSQSYFFVIERISGNQIRQSYSGRSISALADAGEKTVGPGLTSAIADELVSGTAWNDINYLLPDEYGFTGNPVSGLVDLAGITGAVLRSDQEGILQIRKRFPVRPVVLSDSTPDIRLDNPEIIGNPSGEWKDGTNEGRIFIYGYSMSSEPASDIEETGKPVGSDVVARIWWQTDNPPDLSAWASDGTIVPAGFDSVVFEEEVSFQDGPVTVSKPIWELIGIDWVGTEGGTVTAEKYSKELTAQNIPALGVVRYRAVFQRLVARGHDVTRLLLALDMLTGLDTSVDLIIDEADPVAPSITETRIPSLAVAVARGTAELDRVRYRQQEVNFSADYHPDLWDGAVAYLGHPENEMAGNYIILAGSYDFNGPQIKATLRAVRFTV